MYIEKRYPLKGVIIWSRKYLKFFVLLDLLPVSIFYFLDWKWIAIPWQPIAVIGIGVSFYLGFKNNSSYDRLWEARKIWGGIVNASRSFTVMSRDFIQSTTREDLELNEIRKTIVHRHVAWLKALTYQLRILKPWEHQGKDDALFRERTGNVITDEKFEALKEYLSDEEFIYMMSKGNKASHLISLQSKHIAQLRKDNLIDDFRHMELQNMLEELYTLQGKSERIKNFPFPRQYATINFIFVWVFITMLPFGMLTIFSSVTNPGLVWLSVPFSIIVSWVFMLMEMVGDYSENPFEGSFNDVPITSMARSIEIDIRQMLDEEELPAPLGTIDGKPVSL